MFLLLGQLLYMLLLHAGPSIETVKHKITIATGVSSSELVYVGGYLRRESKALFRYDGDVAFVCEHQEISPNSQTFDVIINFLKDMKVNIGKEVPIKIIKFTMEFDTVFCIISRNQRWIVFCGNIVM